MTTAGGATSISLERVQLHNDATIRSRDPLIVETGPMPSAFAISLPLVLVEQVPHLRHLPVRLSARVRVNSGELGCVLVGSDWTTLLGAVPPAVGRGSHTIHLAWEYGGLEAQLVFTNAGPDSVPCVFQVDSVCLGPVPARLPAPLTRLQYVSDRSMPGAMRLTGFHDSVQLHNDATIRSRDPLIVETGPMPSAFAISLPLVLVEQVPHLRHLPVRLSARVRVDSGELGCMLVGSDWTTLLGAAPPAVGRGSHTIHLAWEYGGLEAQLVFTNAGPDSVPCVFQVDSVSLGPVPARLLAPLTRLQYVSDRSMPGAMRLTGFRDSVQLHNAASAAGDGLSFVTDPAHWSYSVSIPIDVPAEPDPGLEALLVVDVHVLEGTVGVGVVNNDMNGFLSSEVDTHEATGPARVELRAKSGGAPVHLMFRNSRDGGASSRFSLLGVTLQFVPRLTAILTAKAPPRIDAVVHGAPSMTGVFDLLVSHTSRRWVAEQCDREYLRERWARPDRLQSLPPFDTLPPHSAPYYGLLSVLRIELSANGVAGRVLRHFVSPERVVHAAVMGRRVVVIFDDGVALFDRQDGDEVLPDPDSSRRLSDPWFGGLHTVIPVDETTCLISSSGADAILWLDTARGEVVRRWRLPADQYGTNYALDHTTSLGQHYVANDFQLGHLNCAAPDGRGGVYVSVLGQGDIGHLRASGEYERIATGFVGCHGVRFAEADNLLYFSDSCSGRLMRVDGRDQATALFETGSRWLHDAVQLAPGLFLMTAGDRNRLVLGDVARGRALAEWDFSAAEGTVQFLSVAARRA